jgi:preprotein translocase subunit SecE
MPNNKVNAKNKDTKINNGKKDNKKKVVKSDSNQKKWFKDFKSELKKIIWPSQKQLWENTAVVISMVVIVSVIIFLLDLGFKALNELEVKGAEDLKNKISTSQNTTNELSNDVNSVETNESSEDSNQTEATNIVNETNTAE